MKKKNIQIFRNFLIISLPTFIFLFLIFEFIVFRFVLPASQLPQLEFDEEYLILKPSIKGPRSGYQSMGQWTKNASIWKINNFGWVNNSDYTEEKKRPRLAIIGDSYVMGLEVNTDDIFPQLLNEKYQDSMDVFSFGMAGSPLSNYLYMTKYVVENFDPDILLINVVFNDFKESVYDYSTPSLRRRFWTYKIMKNSLIQENSPDTLSLREGRLNNFLKSCATGRYLYHNIKVTQLRKYFSKKPTEPKTQIKEFSKNAEHQNIRKTVNTILEKMKSEFPNKRIIFTLDGLRREIIHDLPFEESKLNANRMMLKELCESNDIEFIDLSIPFLDDYKKNKKDFGFKIDPHWNSYGHSVVAKIIFDYLNQNKK